MADNDREDAANQSDDNENEEPRPPVEKRPDSESAPAPGDDIIIK